MKLSCDYCGGVPTATTTDGVSFPKVIWYDRTLADLMFDNVFFCGTCIARHSLPFLLDDLAVTRTGKRRLHLQGDEVLT